MKLSSTKSRYENIFQKELMIGDFIPYKTHWNATTIITKDNSLMQVIKLNGFSFETADDIDIDLRKNMRNSLFKSLSSGSISIYFHTIRRRKSLENHQSSIPIDPSVDIPNDFVSYLEREWKKKYSTLESYVNELYITITFKPDKGGAAIFEHWYKQLMQKSDKNKWGEDMREMYDGLVETTSRIINTFADYEPNLLAVKETEDGYYCEICEFLGTLINCGNSMPMLLPTMDLDKYLGHTRLYFGSRSIEAKGPQGSKFAGMVSVKEYGPMTAAGIFDSFLQMPFEFVMTQSFSFANRSVAIAEMQLQQDRMIQAEDKAVSQIAEISEALDMAMSGDIGFGKHHLTIMVTDSDLKRLENSLSQAVVELSNCGLEAVRETVNMEPTYWGQLPGNTDFLVRLSTINTLNLASFASQHNYPTGKMYGNHWGEYVTILDTTSGTPFYFSFHVRDVGHTMIIGPTGAGKTVLMNFLCAQAQKFKCRMYFFDKDRGAEIFIRALDGVYTVIDPGKKVGFNPLQLDNTGENRTFLLEWLKTLVTVNGETLNAEDIKLLTIAIDGNYKLDKRDRILRNIVPFLGMDGPGSLASRIGMWHSKGSHANVFDNDIDAINLDESRVFGFEMAELLKDPMSLSPVLLYLFHRINLSLDGQPTMIVLDEAWALIDNKVFAPKIKDWLKVLRKLNAFVIFATQSVEDAAGSEISDTLIQQTATQIFLPNLKATDVYKSAFMVSDREYQLIKTTDPSSRFFLVKQGIKAVVARVNLSGMDNIINVLSGRTETVLLVDKLRKEYSEDPEVWLPIFYERAKKV